MYLGARTNYERYLLGAKLIYERFCLGANLIDERFYLGAKIIAKDITREQKVNEQKYYLPGSKGHS